MHPIEYPPLAILTVEIHDGLPALNEFRREKTGEHRLTLSCTAESYVVLSTEEHAVNQRFRPLTARSLAPERAEALCGGLHRFYRGKGVVSVVLVVLVEHDADASAFLA